jgi:hypothetical protein
MARKADGVEGVIPSNYVEDVTTAEGTDGGCSGGEDDDEAEVYVDSSLFHRKPFWLEA